MWAQYAREVTRTLGETPAHPGRGENVVLRRPGSLEDVAADATPRQLAVVVPALAGAVSLSLRLLSSGKIRGTLPEGARLTIGATTYTTATAAAATPGATALTVALADEGGLVAPAVADAVVDLEPDALFILTDSHVCRRMRKDLARPLQADHLAVVTVPVDGQPVTPRLNDQLQLEDGTVGRVSAVPVTTGAFWKLQMGGG